MPLVDRAMLRSNHQGVIERLVGDSAFGLMHPEVTARLVQDVSVESRFEQYGRPFVFLGDEAGERGGHETGPSPMRYFLSGLGFCLLGWWAKGSAEFDIELESLEVRIRTLLDMRGEHAVGDVPQNPQWLVLEITAATPADAERVIEAIDWGDERCPLGVLVRKAIPVYERVSVNGAVVRDDVPADLR